MGRQLSAGPWGMGVRRMGRKYTCPYPELLFSMLRRALGVCVCHLFATVCDAACTGHHPANDEASGPRTRVASFEMGPFGLLVA